MWYRKNIGRNKLPGDPARYETYWNTIEGVYFAGDAATKDRDGDFRVQGRVDDVIKVSGHRLGSMEIESSLVSHPAVAEAAAIGKPDEVKGERVKVFIIQHTGSFNVGVTLFVTLHGYT